VTLLLCPMGAGNGHCSNFVLLVHIGRFVGWCIVNSTSPKIYNNLWRFWLQVVQVNQEKSAEGS